MPSLALGDVSPLAITPLPCTTMFATGVGVRVGDVVQVGDGVSVGDAVLVGVIVGVAVGVGVAVLVGVSVDVGVGVLVGVAVLMTMLTLALLWLPAWSVAISVIVFDPSGRLFRVAGDVQGTPLHVTAMPSEDPPSSTVKATVTLWLKIIEPGAGLVMIRFGGVVSTTKLELALDWLPARSTAATTKVWVPSVTFRTCGEMQG